MIPTYDHQLVASFCLWFDNYFLSKGQAFKNVATQLYPVTDNKFKSKTTFAAPFKQWVADSSISGASIPSGIYVNNSFVSRGTSGLRINYDDGLVMFDAPINGTISGNYSYKDVNVYYTNDSDEQILINSKYQALPRTTQTLTGLATDVKTAPCAIIKYSPGSNTGFEFGGTQLTTSHFKVFVISESSYLLDGILSLFRDSQLSYFTLVDYAQLPFNEFGDFKGGNTYNYQSLITNDPAKMIYIPYVEAYKLSEKAGIDLNRNAFVGMIAFDVSKPRKVK